MLFQAWRGLPSFRGEAASGTWAYRVALNTALGWRRQQLRRERIEGPAPPDLETSGAAAADGAEQAVLDGFLASLTPVDRSILILYMEGTGQREIGDVIGISEGAVGVRIHRIKAQFKQQHL
jgi:RNA polymerase sigma-70 factor (ECF subfamily)